MSNNKIDINNCKIDLFGADLKSLNNRLKFLNIKGYELRNPYVPTLDPIRSLHDRVLNNYPEFSPPFMFIRNGRTVMVGLKPYYDSIELPELKIIEIFNIKTNNMSQLVETQLKLAKQPKTAKNITVGKVYKGIYVNDDDTQVDRIEDAKYFFCNNDNGGEARYSISLFERPVVARPPRVYTYQEVLDLAVIDEYKITFSFENNTVILDLGANNIDCDDTNISCGINQLYDIDETYDTLWNELASHLAEFPSNNISLENLAKDLFTEIVDASISECSGKFVLLSTTTSKEEVCSCMDSILAKRGGTSRIGINPNSGHEIKIWVIDIQ